MGEQGAVLQDDLQDGNGKFWDAIDVYQDPIKAIHDINLDVLDRPVVHLNNLSDDLFHGLDELAH